MDIKKFKKNEYSIFNRTIENVKADILNGRKNAVFLELSSLFDIFIKLIIEIDCSDNHFSQDCIDLYNLSFQKYKLAMNSIGFKRNKSFFDIIMQDFEYNIEERSKIYAFHKVIKKYFISFSAI